MTDLLVPGPRYQLDDAVRAWVRGEHPPGTLALVDPEGVGETVGRALGRVGIRVETYPSPSAALVRAPSVAPRAVVITAHAALDGAADAVSLLRREYGLAVLLALGAGDVERATPAILAGASPVLDLPLRAAQLLRHLRRVWLEPPAVPRTLRLGGLELDQARASAHLHGKPLAVTGTEFGLLWRLAEHDGSAVRRQALWPLWPWAADRDGALVAAVIRLRRKLAYGGFSGTIRTVRGVGYRLDAPAASIRASRSATRPSTSSAIRSTTASSWPAGSGTRQSR